MAMYKLMTNGVLRQTDGAFIPNAQGNKDWNAYLAWVTAGGVADPADVIDPWDAGRRERDRLLRECDYTQLADAPFDPTQKAQMATYRQELRDLPATYPDFGDVVWPTMPTF